MENKKNRLKLNIILSLIFTIFIFSTSTVFAAIPVQEKIEDFKAQIKINSDASVFITETIKYNFGDLEKHGIYRNIPVVYDMEKGRKTINLELQNVTLDGQTENFLINRDGQNQSIKIGKASSTIKGEHTYVITYKVSNVINYFKDVDEFYWDVTGNDWQIPIEKVSASVEIPKNEGSSVINCYQGVAGSNQTCITKDENGLPTASSTKVLLANEGLTIAFDFSKGIVVEPSKFQNIISFAMDNPVMFLPFVTFIIMFILWRRNGRDPKGLSTIIAIYEPPMNIKPTLIGSLVDERPDYRDITAGLIYLAEQGFVKIKRLEKEWFLGNVDYEIELVKTDLTGLEVTEQNILRLFFDDTFTVGSLKKISSFKKDFVFVAKVKKMIADLYQEMADRGFFVKNPSKAKMPYIILGPLLIFFGTSFFAPMFGTIGMLSIGVSGGIIFIFGIFMGKMTKLGAETKDYILGFKKFLSVTEKDRLDFHNAPERNPEQFMKFLPYAIAFGVENKWAKQFENIYIPQPNWYNSNMTGAFVATSLMSHMSDFSKSISTGLAMNSKGAAGGGFGGGGGGFSGGGFGGGGGGSW